MYFVIYTSYAKQNLLESELKALLIQARENNKLKLITGLLLYFDSKFIQLIEGEENEIKNLYEVIAKDERHKDVFKLKEGPIESRFFEDWSMAFKTTSPTNFFELEGYKDIDAADGRNTSSALKLFKILSAETKV